MRIFARASAIKFGIALGVLAAGAVAFWGYAAYRAVRARRAEGARAPQQGEAPLVAAPSAAAEAARPAAPARRGSVLPGAIMLGVLAAGVLAFAGYAAYRAVRAGGGEEQARAAATAVAQERTTATARRQEDGPRQAAAPTTTGAIRSAARRCADPDKLAVAVQARELRFTIATGTAAQYIAGGTVRNTCNYDIDFRIELTALAADGSAVLAARTIAVGPEGEELVGSRQAVTRIRPGEEWRFAVPVTSRPRPDVGSIRAVPIIVREGDPF